MILFTLFYCVIHLYFMFICVSLSAVIAGGVIGFLFAIFLILLLVYRMRKKDEGSYDLGERKSPGAAYQKAPSKEFYAWSPAPIPTVDAVSRETPPTCFCPPSKTKKQTSVLEHICFLKKLKNHQEHWWSFSSWILNHECWWIFLFGFNNVTDCDCWIWSFVCASMSECATLASQWRLSSDVPSNASNLRHSSLLFPPPSPQGFFNDYVLNPLAGICLYKIKICTYLASVTHLCSASPNSSEEFLIHSFSFHLTRWVRARVRVSPNF